MKISVIIPCYNAATTIGACIDAIAAQSAKPSEILVIDDASTDDSADIAAGKAGVKVVRLEFNRGAAFARNAGAARATGDLLLFVDSDVALKPDAIAKIEKVFSATNPPDALVGSYSERPPTKNFFSVAHNYFTFYNHSRESGEIKWFWGAIGCVRAEAFAKVGGFNDRKYTGASSEDIELGFRLARADSKILIDHSIVGDHLVRFDFKKYLTNDFRKSILGAVLFLEENRKLENKHGFASSQNGAAVVTAGLFAFFFSMRLLGFATIIPAITCLVLFYVFSAPYLAFIFSKEDFSFFLKASLMHLCAFIAISVGAGIGVLKYFLAGEK